MFGIYQSRYSYWAHAKPVKWVRSKIGLKDLKCGTSEEWAALEKFNKAKNKALDWATDDFIDRIQDICYLPYDVMNTIMLAFNARFIDSYWTARSDLPRWKYHEVDTRMLHCNFELLVNFVEYEKASMMVWCDDEERAKIKWYKKYKPFKYFFDRANPENGLKYLDWESSLIQDASWFGYETEEEAKEKYGDKYGQPTAQAIKAMKIKELYLWWKNVRPARPDPYEVTGYNEYQKTKDPNESMWERFNNIDKTEHEMFKLVGEIDESYEKEDDEKLIELISIRRSLWT